MGGEIFRTYPDRPWGPPSLLYSGYRFFPGVKSGWGVTLTPHLLLVPWSWKSRAIPLLLLWAIGPVQSLSVCTRVHFTFTFYSSIDSIESLMPQTFITPVRYISILKPSRCTIFRVYWILFYMFRAVFAPIIRSSRLYIQRHIYVVQVSWLHASGREMELSSFSCPLECSQQTCMTLTWRCVCTVSNSWWWTKRPSETCGVIFNKLEKLCI